MRSWGETPPDSFGPLPLRGEGEGGGPPRVHAPPPLGVTISPTYRDRDQRDFARRLRNQPTDAEKHLWFHLRAGQLDGRKFRRQAALGPYVVDFICFARRLIVELDGPQHLEEAAAEHDARRTAWLAQRGYRVMRFRNHEVDEEVRRVVETIRQALEEAVPTPLQLPSPALPSEGEGAGWGQQGPAAG